MRQRTDVSKYPELAAEAIPEEGVAGLLGEVAK
jgi:hypothetical protein